MNSQPEQVTTAVRSPLSRASLRKFLVPALALAAIVSLSFTTGCSSASSTSNTATSTTVSSAPTQVVHVLATSVEKILHTAGASKEHIYGWNHLVGDEASGADSVNVEMLMTVNYTNGSGGFYGVITFTYADGSTLGVEAVNGSAVAATDTTNATLHSDLLVIAGTGKYASAAGKGTLDGSRKDALGGAIDSTFALYID